MNFHGTNESKYVFTRETAMTKKTPSGMNIYFWLFSRKIGGMLSGNRVYKLGAAN